MRRTLGKVAICLASVLFVHCDGAGSRGKGIISDKNTNWLRHCDVSSDCGGGLECIQHLCSRLCAHDRDCSGFSGAAVCARSPVTSTCPESPARPFLCSLPCGEACDQRGLVCLDDACVAPVCAQNGASADGGAPRPSSPDAGSVHDDAGADAGAGADSGRGTVPDAGAPSGNADSGSSADGGSSTPVDAGASVFPPVEGSIVPVRRGNVFEIATDARVLVADPARNRFYAAVSTPSALHLGELVTLDAANGNTIAVEPLDSEPKGMAIGDDGETLWVGSLSGFDLVSFDLTSTFPAPSGRYALPADWDARGASGGLYLVPPVRIGAPTLVDVSIGGGFVGRLTLMDGQLAALPSSDALADRIFIAGPPGYMFSSSSISPLAPFSSNQLAADGIVTSTFLGLMGSYDLHLAYDPDGYVYSYSGDVVDVSNPDAPTRAGSFGFVGAVLPVPGSDTAWMIVSAQGAPNPTILRKLDTATFRQLNTVRIGDDAFSPLSPSSPVAVPSGHLAFLASSDSGGPAVYVMNDALRTADAAVPPVSPVVHGRVTEVPLIATALVTDPVRHRLYATIFGSSSVYGDELVTLDARTGLLLAHVPIGSNPTAMSLSQDSSTLWVGLSGSFALRRVDLSTSLPTPGATYSLLQGHEVESIPASLVALPGNPNSVAVAVQTFDDQRFSGNGVLVFDSGVARGDRTPGGPTRLVPGPAGYLFGSVDQSPMAFYTLSLGATGVIDTQHGTFPMPFGGLSLAYDPDGFVYVGSGDVTAVADPDAPTLAGTFPVNGAVLPLPGTTRAVMASPRSAPSGPIDLHLLDAASFSVMTTVPLDDAVTSYGFVSDLVYVEAGRVAFIAHPGYAQNGSICIVHDDTVIP